MERALFHVACHDVTGSRGGVDICVAIHGMMGLMGGYLLYRLSVKAGSKDDYVMRLFMAEQD